MIEVNKIYCENNLATMGRMPAGFVDLTVTSPPYDELRDYKGYSFDFEKMAPELFRVTKPGGVVVWIVGDSVVDGSETGNSFRQALGFMAVGFNLHDTMIYRKNGAAYPANEKSQRYTQEFEFMFVLSKGTPKTVNLLKDKKNKWFGASSFGQVTERMKGGGIKVRGKRTVGEFAFRTNIWAFNNGHGYSSDDEIAYKHPAIFPEYLAADHIKTWTNEGDLVFDCFGGSGTTAKMAYLSNRKWILSEISPAYVDIANERIKPYLQRQQIF